MKKSAVMDTVDAGFTHEWLDNLEQILDGKKAGLSDCTAHGAGSCCKYCQFSEGLSGYHGSCNCKGIYHDSAIFLNWIWKERGWRVTNGGTLSLGKHQSDLCLCTYGALAGSYGYL